MDLAQIRYFLALAQTLNFTRAAELCNVTQPALTKSVKRLEAELGGLLLLRERSNTQLTELGTAMRPLLQQSFDAAEAARANARQFHARDRQPLRLAFSPGVEPSVTIPLIQQVRQRFAALELTVRDGDAGELNAWLLDSQVDVVLTTHPAELTERANRWVVFADPVVAVMPEVRGADGPIDAGALQEKAVIGRLAETERQLEHRYGLSRAVRHRAATEEHLHMLVRAGIGIGLSTARRRSPADLVHHPVHPPHAVEVCVAAIAGRPLSQAASAFLRLARARDWGDAA